MSFSENGKPDRHFPAIALGRYVRGCQLSSFKGKYSLKRPDGDLSFRIDGIDFDINVCLRQNTGPMRVVLKSILTGTVPNGAEINTALLNDVIQRRVHMLLLTDCRVIKKGGENEEIRDSEQSLRAPLVMNMREAGAWNKIDSADEMEFDLTRGDRLVLRVRSIDFTDAEPSSLLEYSEDGRLKSS